MSRLVSRLRQVYPQRLLLQNRGLFFLDPRLPHYRITWWRTSDEINNGILTSQADVAKARAILAQQRSV